MFSLIPHRKEERKLGRRFDSPFGRMRSELAELFDRFLGFAPSWGEWPWEELPTGLEVVEREKDILVRVEVPGFEPAELVVEMAGNVLTIRGEHVAKEEAKKEEMGAVERPYARLLRSMLLPEGIDVEKVEVTCKNGLLEVILPRKPEAVPRRLEVKT